MSWTGHRPLTHAVLERLLESLAAGTQSSCTVSECAFVAGCEFIAAAHNGDLGTYFRHCLPDVRALAADAMTRLCEPVIAARLLAAASADTFIALTADINACSQQLDAGLERWAAQLSGANKFD